MANFGLLHYAIVFLVVALVAAAAGFGGVAGVAAGRQAQQPADLQHGALAGVPRRTPKVVSVPHRAHLQISTKPP